MNATNLPADLLCITIDSDPTAACICPACITAAEWDGGEIGEIYPHTIESTDLVCARCNAPIVAPVSVDE